MCCVGGMVALLLLAKLRPQNTDLVLVVGESLGLKYMSVSFRYDASPVISIAEDGQCTSRLDVGARGMDHVQAAVVFSARMSFSSCSSRSLRLILAASSFPTSNAESCAPCRRVAWPPFGRPLYAISSAM